VERPDLTEEEQFTQWEAELPPHEHWLINPAKMQIETPTDERGLVNIRALVALGKATIDQTYMWDTRKVRDDHLYWPETAFRKLAWKIDDSLPMVFRNLPPNIVRFPLDFERWKHAITIPADFPSLEVMDYYTQAWFTARDLYISVAKAVEWERLHRRRKAGLLAGTSVARPRNPEDVISEEYIAGTLADYFKGASRLLEQHQRLPQEFRLIQEGDNARAILHTIGHQVRHQCQDGLRGRGSRFVSNNPYAAKRKAA
jgi:hypothetical protein